MEKFRYEANGYNKEDVNHFLSRVIKEMDSAIEIIRVQREKIHCLNDKLKKYQEFEKVQDDIVFNAKTMASQILNDSLKEIEEKRKVLDSEYLQMRKKLQLIVEQQQAVIKDIDHLKSEDE